MSNQKLTRTPKLLTVSNESVDMGFNWRDGKTKFISNSNISWVRIYGKLRLKAWHEAINAILEYYRVAHQRKQGWSFSSSQTRTMRSHSFCLAVRLNTGLGRGFFTPSSMITLWGHWSNVSIGWPIGAMYSEVWTPIKEDPEKGIGRFSKPKTWSPWHPLCQHCRFTQSAHHDRSYQN